MNGNARWFTDDTMETYAGNLKPDEPTKQNEEITINGEIYIKK